MAPHELRQDPRLRPASRRSAREPAQDADRRAARAGGARKPGTLSGGEAQRLSLARALAGEPRLLLLDEPLGPLDAELRAALLERIDGIQRSRELTLIHVTHDPAESEAYTDRTLTMADGAIRSDGRPAGGAA